MIHCTVTAKTLFAAHDGRRHNICQLNNSRGGRFIYKIYNRYHGILYIILCICVCRNIYTVYHIIYIYEDENRTRGSL